MKNKAAKIMLWAAALMLILGIGVRLTVPVQAEETEKQYIQLNQENTLSKGGWYYFNVPGNGKLSTESGLYQIYQGDSGKVSLKSDCPCRLAAGEYRIKASGTVNIAFTAEPASSYEQEFNDNFDTANVINTNIVYTGSLNQSDRSFYADDEDYYKVTLPSDGSLYLELMPISLDGRLSFILYKEDNNLNVTELLSNKFASSMDSQKSAKLRVATGVYYLKVVNGSDSHNYVAGVDYQFKVAYNQESSSGFETEDNNTQAAADLIMPNVSYNGNLQSKDDVDYYMVTLPSTGKMTLRLQTPRQTKDKLFKAELLKQADDGTLQALDTVYSSENPVVFGQEQLLEAGVYYVRVQPGNAGGYYSSSITDDDTHVDYILQCVYDEQSLVQGITVSSDVSELKTGDTAQLTAAILPADAANKSIQWTCSDTRVARVDQSGKLTCVAPGEAIVSARAQDGSNIYGEFHVVVNKRLVESVELSASKETLSIGEKVTVTTAVTPSNADNTSVVWESSNPKVATVNDKGVVTAVAAGKTSIKAIAEDGSGAVGSLTIEVSRKKSTSATLKSITVSKGTLNKSFSSKRTAYVLTLNRNTSSVKITPKTTSKYASFTINGKEAKSVTVKVAPKKSKWVKIVVTSESGNQKTYKIKVVRK